VIGATGSASFPGGDPPAGGTSNVVVVALDGLRMPGGEPAVEQRTVRYGYDGLARLTAATETPGRRYRYAYDGVGNRSGVWVNDVPTATMQYDAANQVLRWSYDAAGNLLSDGTRTLRYDALGRLSSAAAAGTTTRYGYNGDGVLVTQTTTGTTTSYTQDLQAPLSQVLEQTTSGTTTRYWYGRERLAAVADSTHTWSGTDALGSVRQTLTDTGSASTPLHYDPWGTPTEGTPPTFGFTSELQDALGGLVHLRARWYLPAQGAFASRDPFAGFPAQPYSLHPYQYGYSNPALYTDPTGKQVQGGSCVLDAQGHPLPTPALRPVPMHGADASYCPPAPPRPLTWDETLDGIQVGLDGAGLVPGLGEPADVANALISAGRGNWGDAALSACAAVPVLGWGATGAKWAKRGYHATEALLDYGPDIAHRVPMSQLDEVAPPSSRAHHGDNIGGNGGRTGSIVPKTRWGYKGTSSYSKVVNEVRYNQNTLEEVGGVIPTRQEAEQLIADAGGQVLRVERGHPTPNPHNYPHINYTIDGKHVVTIRVEGVGRQYHGPGQKGYNR
jgi:RHS repeat-associated protein